VLTGPAFDQKAAPDGELTRIDTTTRNVPRWFADPDNVEKFAAGLKVAKEAVSKIPGADGANGFEPEGIAEWVHGLAVTANAKLDADYPDGPIKEG